VPRYEELQSQVAAAEAQGQQAPRDLPHEPHEDGFNKLHGWGKGTHSMAAKGGGDAGGGRDQGVGGGGDGGAAGGQQGGSNTCLKIICCAEPELVQ
jgi:hypothetical protein